VQFAGGSSGGSPTGPATPARKLGDRSPSPSRRLRNEAAGQNSSEPRTAKSTASGTLYLTELGHRHGAQHPGNWPPGPVTLGMLWSLTVASPELCQHQHQHQWPGRTRRRAGQPRRFPFLAPSVQMRRIPKQPKSLGEVWGSGGGCGAPLPTPPHPHWARPSSGLHPRIGLSVGWPGCARSAEHDWLIRHLLRPGQLRRMGLR
jgi:hypothetical protein